jgi:hypothetical protein
VSLLELLDLFELLSTRDGLLYLFQGFGLLILQLFESVFHQSGLEVNFFLLQSREEHVLAQVTLRETVD